MTERPGQKTKCESKWSTELCSTLKVKVVSSNVIHRDAGSHYKEVILAVVGVGEEEVLDMVKES